MPMWTVPPSVAGLLAWFAPCFTAPTFQTFTALACGFLAQTGPRTVTGMLLGARLSRVWSHDRAHAFFARARWSADQLGLGLVDLLATVLLAGDAPLRVMVDDTLMRRSGRKVFGASWHHDPLAAGRRRSPGATTGWSWASWLTCRLCPSGRCACRCLPACGAPSAPRPGWSWGWSWSGCSPSGIPPGAST